MTVAPTPVGRHSPPHLVPLLAVVGLVALAVGLALGYRLWNEPSSSGKLEGSGVAAVQARDLPPFSSVDLRGASNVSVTVGDRQSVVVRADDNLLRRVTTNVETGTLVIGTTGSFTTHNDLHVLVAVPTLDAVTLSGSGNITVEGVHATMFDVLLSGTGVLRVSGKTDELDATLNGTGDAELGALVAKKARAEVQGTGRIVVHAKDSLDAAVFGVGAIVYLGTPKTVTTHVTGTGAIVHGG